MFHKIKKEFERITFSQCLFNIFQMCLFNIKWSKIQREMYAWNEGHLKYQRMSSLYRPRYKTQQKTLKRVSSYIHPIFNPAMVNTMALDQR